MVNLSENKGEIKMTLDELEAIIIEAENGSEPSVKTDKKKCPKCKETAKDDSEPSVKTDKKKCPKCGKVKCTCEKKKGILEFMKENNITIAELVEEKYSEETAEVDKMADASALKVTKGSLAKSLEMLKTKQDYLDRVADKKAKESLEKAKDERLRAQSKKIMQDRINQSKKEEDISESISRIPEITMSPFGSNPWNKF